MKISVEDALEIVERKTQQGGFSKVQEIVFCQCWQGYSYQEIAKNSGYQLGYIRDVGHKLWQSLSSAFGQKITKTNFQRVLNQYHLAASYPQAQRLSDVVKVGDVPTSQISPQAQRQDWGEVIDVSMFFGRDAELATLKQWIEQESCRLVSLCGVPGVGKTSLAVCYAEQVQNEEFDFLIWRSLRNAQPIKELLTEIILFLSQQQIEELPQTVDGLLTVLMKYLRQYRCLLILDNYEAVLQSGGRAGRYRDGYEGYGQMLRQVADERHQSCLLLTTREIPISLTVKEGNNLPVRSLQLSGLSPEPAYQVLQSKGLVFSIEEAQALVRYYAGNPLALKIAAASIQSLYKKDISKFLSQGRIVFGDIRDLLEQQFKRLSHNEKQIVLELASYQQAHLLDLEANKFSDLSQVEVLEAIQSLQQRSLLEKGSLCFTQPRATIEYINEVINHKTETSILKFATAS